MPKDLSLNTIAALTNAPRSGLVLRDLVYLWPTNLETGEEEPVGMWTGSVNRTIPVINPRNGNTVERDYLAAGTLVKVSPIPAKLETEVRTISVTLSGVSTDAVNAIRGYNAKMARIEIHRAIFTTDTRTLVDPALCRFSGFINRAPITIPKPDDEGTIRMECVSSSRVLTRTSAIVFSDETLKKRGGDRFGKYLDVAGAWKIFWGQEEANHKGRNWKKRKFFK